MALPVQRAGIPGRCETRGCGIVTEDGVITLETKGSLTVVGRGRVHRAEAALGR